MPITFIAAGTVALNNTAATTLSVPYPAGIQAGDVIAMPVGVNSATIATLPSGWLAGGVSSASGGNAPSERIMLKVCTGTESGSVNVTTASATSRGQMLLFRGVDNTTPLDNAGSVTASATATTTYALPSMTTTAPGAALILVGVANTVGGTWTSPTSPGAFIETAETTGAIPSMGVQYLIWSGSGATGTVNYARSTNVRGCTGMLALRPASTSTPPGQSSGGGTWAFAGSGSGTKSVRSSGSGVFAFVGTGSATTARRSSGSGVFAFAGAGSGRTARRSTGSGSFAFAGSGSGITSRRSSGSGSWAFIGTGTGRRAARSSGSGTFAYVGSGTGSGPAVGTRQGTGSGVWAFIGSGSGKSTRRASGTSAFAFVGGGYGSTQRAAAGSGATTWTGAGSAGTYTPPTEFHGRILSAALFAPQAEAELVIDTASGHLRASAARARLAIPTATGELE